MASPEDIKQEVVVGLYDRGKDQPSHRRIIDIGTSKILKSGIWSPYLINLRPVLSADRDSKVGTVQQLHTRDQLLDLMGGEIDGIYPKSWPRLHLFGLPEAGTPLAAAVAARGGYSLLWQRVVPKQGYGSHQSLEGAFSPGDEIVQIDDVITTGGTKHEGAELMAENELTTSGVVVAFDREQGGKEAVEQSGIPLESVLGAIASFGYLLDARRITMSEHDFLVEYTINPTPRKEPSSHPWKLKE
jgi:orotate phosphoribosyltransferase